MPISSEEYRNVLRHFPAGVTIVAVQAGEETHGLTVSAFASIAPQPPQVLVIIDHRHRAYRLLEKEGAVFSVNILGQDQVELSNRFAWVKDQDRFAVGDWKTAATGAPVLGDAVAWMDCTIVGRYAAETNTLYVGRIEAAAVPRPEAPPLLYWNRGYRRLDLRHGDPEP
jgi:flavin reductase (DIM6/NTAB) family NADH-FMN oxidoreductase RutF